MHRLLLTVAFLTTATTLHAQTHIDPTPRGVHITQNNDAVNIDFLTPAIAHIHVIRNGKPTPRTPVIDPTLTTPTEKPAFLTRTKSGAATSLTTPALTLTIDIAANKINLAFTDKTGRPFLAVDDLIGNARGSNIAFLHDETETLYGMTGLDRTDTGAGITRNGGAKIVAGTQGNSGAPFFFTTRYGVLVDSDGGSFEPLDETLRFRRGSRPDVEFFVLAGPPLDVMASLATLVGRPPMPPKWTLGFMNSQWGSDEAELKALTHTYREKHIPIDAFILDFDWKAWGEDNYGEWRWNSTSGPGASQPNRFPDGASGLFAKDELAQGIKLAGILKPRILINKPGSTTELDEAAKYATDHGFFYPNEVRDIDYVTRRPAGNIDFNNPAARTWFWQHTRPTFDTGITAWWNDEADYSNTTIFNNFQFLDMGRMLYDGQRSLSTDPALTPRVWSINRNFYLGATRYGYALWSGDITTGFQSMAYQRRRMLAALNTGAIEWSMDTGGFVGHPTPENYARWMEFAAFVPIFRVHGDHNEKRQPWVYGPLAEAAAKRAIDLRYSLLPSLYSYTRTATETGIAVVRPLLWAFPNDATAATTESEWLFGPDLLVSPVVTRNATTQSVYLPAGTWFDYAKGTRLTGPQTLAYPVDSATWQDIPLFIREGAILATQPPQDFVGQSPVSELTLDIFPSSTAPSAFTLYDDDGATFAYERNAFFRQQITATPTDITVEAPTGTFSPTYKTYLLKLHTAATTLTLNGKLLPKVSTEAGLMSTSTPVAFTATDKFGPVTVLRLPAATPSHVALR